MWDAGSGGFSNDAGGIFIASKGFLCAVKETGLSPDCPAFILRCMEPIAAVILKMFVRRGSHFISGTQVSPHCAETFFFFFFPTAHIWVLFLRVLEVLLIFTERFLCTCGCWWWSLLVAACKSLGEMHEKGWERVGSR